MITPGAESSRGAPTDSAIEDQLNLAGSPDVQVLADDLLEEDASGHRPIEHLRQRELGLQDRQRVAVAAGPVAAIERVRQARQPFAQQPVDLLVVQPIADALQCLGVRARQHAVVQRLEGDAALAQLAFGVLVAVDAELGVVGEVRTEFQEERAEVCVDAIEVEVVDHRRAVDHPGIGRAGVRVATALGTHDTGLLLRPSDVQHAFVGVEALQILLGEIVLALVLAEADQIHAGLADEALDIGHERLGLGGDCRRRREALAEMAAKIPDHAAHALQLGNVDAEVHPIDALALEHDMVAQDIANAV